MSSNSLAAAGLIGVVLSLLSLAAIDGASPPASNGPSPAPRRQAVSGQALRALRTGGRLDINRASARELELLPGIGPRLAQRILADRHTYKVGETARVQLHWRDDPALALVTFQGARILDYRLVRLQKGSNVLEIPMSSKLAPLKSAASLQPGG